MLTPEDAIEMGLRAHEAHQQLLSTIAVSKEYLGMSYDTIRKMPLRDFFDLLKIRSEEERRKAEYLHEQQRAMVGGSSASQSNKRTPAQLMAQFMTNAQEN